MNSHEEQAREKQLPYPVDEGLLINSRLREIERQQEEEKKYQREYNNKQLRFNGLLVVFTALLFVTSGVSDVLMLRYVGLTKQSADAATSAAKTASETLSEIKKSSTDTHELAVAAKTQADSTKELATRALAQLAVARRMADQTQRTADLATQALAQGREQLRLFVRPWVGLTDDVGNGIDISPITFDGNGNARIEYVIRPKNFSSAAAQNVAGFARLVVTKNLDDVRAEQRAVCGTGDPGKAKLETGNILFPGTSSFVNKSGWSVNVAGLERRQITAWVVGCIFYRDQFDHLYRTRFTFVRSTPSGLEDTEFRVQPNTTVEGVWQPFEMSLE